MALAHELAHLRRGDLWLGWIPALAQRAFFFHPLARWAMREYAFHREAACDAQVLDRARAEPQDYGRLLLRLGVAFPVASGLAGASPTFQNLKRRLTLLQQTERTPPQFGAWLLVALVALAGALPYRVTARGMDMTVHAYDGGPTSEDQASPSPTPTTAAVVVRDVAAKPAASAAPMPKPAAKPVTHALAALSPMPTPSPVLAIPATPATPATPAAPASPATPAAPNAPSAPYVTPLPEVPAPPPAPPAPQAPVRVGHRTYVDVDISGDTPRAFAIIEPNYITLQGTQSDLATARKLQRGDEPLLWIRRGGETYVVRDRAVLERAKAAYATMHDTAREQGEMAGQQGELAGRQSGLAARVAALSSRRAALGGERAAIASERQRLRQTGSQDAAQDGAAATLDGRLRSIDAQLADLSRQQADIDREQADLDRRQAELSRQQAEISRHERDVAHLADRQVDRLIDEAIADGLAQPADRH